MINGTGRVSFRKLYICYLIIRVCDTAVILSLKHLEHGTTYDPDQPQLRSLSLITAYSSEPLSPFEPFHTDEAVYLCARALRSYYQITHKAVESEPRHLPFSYCTFAVSLTRLSLLCASTNSVTTNHPRPYLLTLHNVRTYPRSNSHLRRPSLPPPHQTSPRLKHQQPPRNPSQRDRKPDVRPRPAHRNSSTHLRHRQIQNCSAA